MSKNERENLSEAFKAIFQTSGINLEKTADFNFDADDALIDGKASMPIYNPTRENIEKLVMSLLDSRDFVVSGDSNPLADKKWLELKIQGYAGPHTDVISDAVGVVHVPVAENQPTVEFPFKIHCGALIPWDVISVKGENIPFSRENIKKISLFLAQKSRDEKGGILAENGKILNPYVKLEEKANPTTSVGFLGNTLHIQDKYRFPLMGDDNGMFVTASHAVDDAIEKLANMTPFDWTAIRNSMMKTAAQEKSQEIDDIFELAKTATDTNIADTLLAIDKMQWENASGLPDSTYIVFPVLENGSELKMQRGIVLSDFANINPDSSDINTKKQSSGTEGVFVLAENGKIRFIKKQDRFMCIRAAEPWKNFKTKKISSFEKGDGAILFLKGKALMPVQCTSKSLIYNSDNGVKRNTDDIDNIKTSNGTDPVCVRLELSAVDLTDRRFSPVIYNRNDGDSFSVIRTMILHTLNGADKLARLTANEYKHLLGRNIGESEDVQSFVSGYDTDKFETYRNHFVINPDAKVLCFTGILDNFFRDKKELQFVLNNHEITKGDELVFLKTAMEHNTVTVECKDKKADKYDVTISFMDKTKKIFSSRIKKFTNIPSYRVKGTLSAIGFEHQKIGEMMYKLKQNGHASLPLPRSFDADRLTGAKSKSAVLSKFNKLRQRVFNDKQLYSVAEDVVSQALTDTPIAKNSRVRSVVTGVNKLAEDGKILAKHFEKLAIDESSQLYKETAKAMLLSSQMFEKTAKMLESDERYPQIMGISEIVKDNGEHFGKLAGSLIYDKLSKTASEGTVIAPWYYGKAIDQISDMYSLSCSYIEKMAEDAPASTEEDSMSEAEKINQQEQLNAMAESEKEDVPGGKHTPTKFVQRKNQHRMNP